MSYTVGGAVVNVADGTALRVRLLQWLSAQVAQFTATVQIPTQFSYIKCTAGNPNSTTPCTFAAAGTEGAQIPTFRDGPRGEGQVVAIEIGFPPDAVAANEHIVDRWTVSRAFSARPLPLALAVGLLVLGGIGLFLLHRRTGADASADGQVDEGCSDVDRVDPLVRHRSDMTGTDVLDHPELALSRPGRHELPRLADLVAGAGVGSGPAMQQEQPDRP